MRSRPGASWESLDAPARVPRNDVRHNRCCCPEHERLEVIDYKHGIGIVVEVENNPQIMYYAYMIIDELGSAWMIAPTTLTIVRPRVTWREPIRSWQTTVGYISMGWDPLLPRWCVSLILYRRSLPVLPS